MKSCKRLGVDPLIRNLSEKYLRDWFAQTPKLVNSPNSKVKVIHLLPLTPHPTASRCFASLWRSPWGSLCWAGQVASRAGANASELCWIFMQMHPSSLPKLHGLQFWWQPGTAAVLALSSCHTGGLEPAHQDLELTGEERCSLSSPDNPNPTCYKVLRAIYSFQKFCWCILRRKRICLKGKQLKKYFLKKSETLLLNSLHKLQAMCWGLCASLVAVPHPTAGFWGWTTAEGFCTLQKSNSIFPVWSHLQKHFMPSVFFGVRQSRR